MKKEKQTDIREGMETEDGIALDEIRKQLKDKPKSYYSRLTPRKQAFVSYLFVNEFDGKDAAIRAGYEAKYASTTAGTNLAEKNIKKAMQEFFELYMDKYDKIIEIKAIRFYMVRAFYDISKIIDKRGKLKVKDLSDLGIYNLCVESIETKPYKDTEYTTVTLVDRGKALKELLEYKKKGKESDSFALNLSINSGVLAVNQPLDSEGWKKLSEKSKNK